MKLYIFEEKNKYVCTKDEKKTRYKECVYVINSVEDIGDFMLSEFEKDKHDAYSVKKRFTKQKEDIEM